ncbi:alpha/beta hydrolase [Rathayibacter soli]|uniref:alpha/beta hydrolase n=1 Tax=Rathayibacter soli TaxID=3144168 RepID=UPI0027E532FA|nr:alpha/beta hydrolase [Glaciibacter superstes]
MASAATQQEWQPDVLGKHFEQLTLPLGSDNEGEVVATLVRHVPPFRLQLGRPVAAGTDVLYVHGWSDYFFQRHLAEFFSRAGARFFALDLRKYGRSLREGQTPGFITDLATYDEDIAAAREAMGGNRRLIVMGHSTGGLIFSLWAERNPGVASAVILNSPWLEFQASAPARTVVAPLVGLGARVDPLARMPSLDFGFYSRSVSAAMDGEWEYNMQWRPERAFAVRPAWLNAILVGHARVAIGLAIDAPVFTMLSAKSTLLPHWTPAMLRSDIVLKVDDIARSALKLGPIVTVARFDGALHDIMLSEQSVREEAFRQLTRWLRGYVAGGVRMS